MSICQYFNHVKSSTVVAASTKTTRGVVRCIYWPVFDVANCSASFNDLCKTYGRTGASGAPTKSELARLIQLRTWSDVAKTRNCAWHP